ncbi:MAG: hypothetical protein NTW26_10695 [bacterium]|nr:hypothetical protein [bacterium]
MKPVFLCLLAMLTAAAAAQDETDPALAASGAGIAALCAENGLSGRVAWVSDCEGDLEIYVMDLDAGCPDRVTYNECADRSPALSPDGRYLAWVSEMYGQPDLYLMDLNDRLWDKLTDTPGFEGDLSWSADGERIYFSSYEAIDYGTVGLFAGSTEELEHLAGRRYSFAVYYYDLDYKTVEPQSLEPGDYRWPCHVAGFGVVCRYEPWSAEVSSFPAGLIFVHDALVTSDLSTPGDEVVGPLRRFPDGTLLVPYREGDWNYCARMDAPTETVLSSRPLEPDRFNLAPDPAGGDWFIGQTAVEGDPTAEIVLFGEGFSESPVEIKLTDNATYDGEPTWAVVKGE